MRCGRLHRKEKHQRNGDRYAERANRFRCRQMHLFSLLPACSYVPMLLVHLASTIMSALG
jgi:hypothetical protein